MAESVSVDRHLCDGYANCVFVAPTVFGLDDENLVVLHTTKVCPDDRENILLAIAECPTRAITLSTDHEETRL